MENSNPINNSYTPHNSSNRHGNVASNSSRKRQNPHGQRSPTHTMTPPSQVPAANIFPGRQTITPDILKNTTWNGPHYSGMRESKTSDESDDCRSYFSSDDDESNRSFPGKQQQFHKLLVSLLIQIPVDVVNTALV